MRFLFLPALPSPEGEGCVLKVLEELVEGIEASLSVLQPPLLLLLTRLSGLVHVHVHVHVLQTAAWRVF